MVQLLKDYGGEIDWNVGALFAHDSFIHNLFDMCQDLGYEIPIKYVFGSIPCKFQGGRFAPKNMIIKEAIRLIESYNSRNIGCRLTFSNVFITEEDLANERSNKLLEAINKVEGRLNGVIVSSDLLAEYIREKYDNLELISSMVKPSCEVGLGDYKDTTEYYNSLFELYDIVVINPSKVNDSDFLRNIKYPERVEFIANHRCVPNCPRAKLHYETQMRISDKYLKEGMVSEEDTEIINNLKTKCHDVKNKNPLLGSTFSCSDIEKLTRLGYKHFKIEGRDNDDITFARDLGDYIFNTYLFNRMVYSPNR